MPIEKLEFYAYPMNSKMMDPSKWELNNVEIIIMTKINELIDFINTREQDRSEKMDRMIDKIHGLQNNLNLTNNCINLINEKYHNGPSNAPENATQPKKEKPLLNCPWCNEIPLVSCGNSLLLSDPPKINWIIRCQNTKCLINPMLRHPFYSKQEAVSAWNRRA